MKKHIHLVISILSVGIFALMAPTSFAQKTDAMSKAQAVAQELNLTPPQKEKILPILTKSALHQERQFAFNCAENATSEGYSSADRSSDEGHSFIRAIPKTEADSCTGNPRSHTRHHGPLADGHQSVSVSSKSQSHRFDQKCETLAYGSAQKSAILVSRHWIPG